MTPGIRELQILKSEYQYYPEYARARTTMYVNALFLEINFTVISSNTSRLQQLQPSHRHCRAAGVARELPCTRALPCTFNRRQHRLGQRPRVGTQAL